MTTTQHVPDSAVTRRPWRGADATTGRTMDEFRESVSFEAQIGGAFPEWLSRAAVSICRAYGIKGICDPAYIANVILGEAVDGGMDPVRAA